MIKIKRNDYVIEKGSEPTIKKLYNAILNDIRSFDDEVGETVFLKVTNFHDYEKCREDEALVEYTNDVYIELSYVYEGGENFETYCFSTYEFKILNDNFNFHDVADFFDKKCLKTKEKIYNELVKNFGSWGGVNIELSKKGYWA